jgi:hypothetical protein
MPRLQLIIETTHEVSKNTKEEIQRIVSKILLADFVGQNIKSDCEFSVEVDDIKKANVSRLNYGNQN